LIRRSTFLMALFSLAFSAGCSKPESEGGASANKPEATAAKSAEAKGPEKKKEKLTIGFSMDTLKEERWQRDRDLFKAKAEALGAQVLVQSANSDDALQNSQAENLLTQGVDVLVVIPHNGETTATIVESAHKQGVPVIAYDRPIAGADYYVSFDNEKVGELEGQMIVDGLKAEKKDPKTAKVVCMSGDPTDGNAAYFKSGALKVMEAAGIKCKLSPAGTWDATKSGTEFQQAYTTLKGDIDAVWTANDANNAAVITVLNKYNKTVPTSGQDASVAGLQNILLGKQYGTVYKPYQLEAAATVKLGKQLLAGQKPEVAKKAPDGTPFIAETPKVVTKDNMEQVFTDGNAKASDVCTGQVKALCAKYNIQ